MPNITEIPAFFKKHPKTWAYRLTPKAIRNELYSRPDRPKERQKYWKQIEELKSNLDSYALLVINGNLDNLVKSKDSPNWSIVNRQEIIDSEDTEFRKANTIKFDRVDLKKPKEGINEFQLQYTTGTIEHVLREKSTDKPFFILKPEFHKVQGIAISFNLEKDFKVTEIRRRDGLLFPYGMEYGLNPVYYKDIEPKFKSEPNPKWTSHSPIWFDSFEQTIDLAQESTLPISNTNLDRKEGSVYLINRALTAGVEQMENLIQG